MQKILVATDGSPTALKAVRTAADLAKAIAGAGITLIAVAKPGPGAVVVSGGYGSMKAAEHARNEAEQEARADLEESAAVLQGLGLPCQTALAHGDPSDDICEYAANKGFDLIVIGNRGRGAITGALLGSVSSGVIRNAHCPVLVVKQ